MSLKFSVRHLLLAAAVLLVDAARLAMLRCRVTTSTEALLSVSPSRASAAAAKSPFSMGLVAAAKAVWGVAAPLAEGQEGCGEEGQPLPIP